MRVRIFLCGLFFASVLFVHAGTGFDKNSFYSALSSDNLDLINAQITAVKASSIPEKEAYEGALLMKKAGAIKSSAKEKLSLFKSGRLKLEASISKDNSNMEYRFLRLIIQEHAPRIVKYRADIETDSQLVRTNFKTLPDLVQKFILDYSKSSKVLKIAG